jgi:hypothetical protein
MVFTQGARRFVMQQGFSTRGMARETTSSTESFSLQSAIPRFQLLFRPRNIRLLAVVSRGIISGSGADLSSCISYIFVMLASTAKRDI